jgi:hypothetical protein
LTFFLDPGYQERAREAIKERGSWRIGPLGQKSAWRCIEDHRALTEGACLMHGPYSRTYIIHPEDAARFGEWLRDIKTEPDWSAEMSEFLWKGFIEDDGTPPWVPKALAELEVGA